MRDSLRASRALAHPVWWVALAALLVNDHVFKGTHALPPVLIGKLSDFAGLLVAPVLLAALLRLRSQRAIALAHLATALVFAGINVSPAFATAFEGLTAHTPWPWTIYVDPTDLLALPMVAVSWAVFIPWMARPVEVAPLLRGGAAILGGWACVATSPAPPSLQFPPSEDRLMIGNHGDEPVLLRVRPLRPDVALDCAAVEADPGALLDQALFDVARTWSLEPGRAVGLEATSGQGGDGCQATWVEGTGIPPRLVFLPEGRWPRRFYPTEAEVIDEDALLAVDDAGWADHPALYTPRPENRDAPTPECALPPAGAGLDWTSPPVAEAHLVAHEVAPDGCHRLELEGAPAWYLCLGGALLPFADGADLSIRRFDDEDGAVLRVHDGATRLTLYRGRADRAPLSGVTVTGDRAEEGCPASADACGQQRLSRQVRIETRATGAWLGSGDSQDLGADHRLDVHVVRAERLPVLDTSCSRLPPIFDPRTDALVELVVTEDIEE